MSPRAARRDGLLAAILAVVIALAGNAAAAVPPPAQVVVVTDENYPPYLFRAADGTLQGIVRDKWELWSERTGVPVRVEGMTWAKAQASVLDNAADVIESLTYTEARTRQYEFSEPYATVEARVYFHRTISGIRDVASMRGFTVGAKDGSACASWLVDNGVETIRRFPTSELLVQAAGNGEVRLFCLDAPAARYYLLRLNLNEQFRESEPLYSAHYHWAVARGRTGLRDFIQDGFARITPQELEAIEDRWLGTPLRLPIDNRYYYYLATAILAGITAAVLMMMWNRTLRRRVAAGLAELSGQKEVLELIAEGAPLATTLEALVRSIETLSPGMYGSVLLLDDDGVHMRHGAAPSLPDAFNRAVDGSAIGASAGSCGTSAFRREAVVVDDIATDPLWESYRDLAAQHGLRACWSTPILDAQRRVLGTFALYFKEPRRPTALHLRQLATATHTAAVAISKSREQAALRDSEARLRLAVHAADIGLWDWDIAGNQLYYSPEWKSQLGYRDDEISNRFEEWRERLHPADRERVLPKVKKDLAAPSGSYETEVRLLHKDGSYRWIYARAQVETDAEGLPVRMVGCHIDVTSRKQAEETLQHSFTRLQELSRRLAEVEEAERRNINRELHDRVGQNLSALNLSLSLARSQIPAGTPGSVPDRLADAQHLAELAVQQVRDVMADLRPAALDDYGLLAALRTYVEPFSARLGVPVTVSGSEPDPRLPSATETALFRIAQEALSNAAKHARARRIDVEFSTWNGRAQLAIHDDGVGFDTESAPPRSASWGLRTMRERAEAVGAKVRVESAPGRGTRITVDASREAA